MSCLVLPNPRSAACSTWLVNSASSSADKYGLGPGFVPCLTRPLRRSFSVDRGTPCKSAALSPDKRSCVTLYRAASICSAVHCILRCGRLGLRIDLEPTGASGERLNPFFFLFGIVRLNREGFGGYKIKRIWTLRSYHRLEAMREHHKFLIL